MKGEGSDTTSSYLELDIVDVHVFLAKNVVVVLTVTLYCL